PNTRTANIHGRVVGSKLCWLHIAAWCDGGVEHGGRQDEPHHQCQRLAMPTVSNHRIKPRASTVQNGFISAAPCQSPTEKPLAREWMAREWVPRRGQDMEE